METEDPPQGKLSAKGLRLERVGPDENRDQLQPSEPLIVAGIGASAGGSEAVQVFFEALPENLGVAFVMMIPLSVEQQSQLAARLAAQTPLPVAQVEGTVPLEADHIYLLPPNRRFEITESSVGTFPFEELH